MRKLGLPTLKEKRVLEQCPTAVLEPSGIPVTGNPSILLKKITGSPSISLKMGGNSGLFQARAPYEIFRAPVHIQVHNLKFL